VALHLAWNRVIQNVFDALSTGTDAKLWVGESGILTTLVIVGVVAVLSRWWRPVLRQPAEHELAEQPAGSMAVPAAPSIGPRAQAS
jgi:hypothetical protein